MSWCVVVFCTPTPQCHVTDIYSGLLDHQTWSTFLFFARGKQWAIDRRGASLVCLFGKPIITSSELYGPLYALFLAWLAEVRSVCPAVKFSFLRVSSSCRHRPCRSGFRFPELWEKVRGVRWQSLERFRVVKVEETVSLIGSWTAPFFVRGPLFSILIPDWGLKYAVEPHAEFVGNTCRP